MSARPYPQPTTPWVMRQTWHDLLFMHWPVSIESLRPHIPPSLTIDKFDGQAWIAVVPFRMSRIAPHGLFPVPWLSAFPELNVRTYVIRDGKPGVPEHIRLKPAASRALDIEVRANIAALAELEFAQHGRMHGSYPDFPPKPDYVVANLIELLDLLDNPA